MCRRYRIEKETLYRFQDIPGFHKAFQEDVTEGQIAPALVLENGRFAIHALSFGFDIVEKRVLNARIETVDQKDFFLYGPLHLKGLTMKEAAEIIGVHEATVSRIANSKYIDTDWGIYPIRSLFSNTVESADGQNISKNAVKEMIRKIISENETGKPLSDQKISDILKERGITAARRTVSKYRKELNIDSSFERGK